METEKETVVGNDVLYLNPSADYNVHFPYKRGDVNLHEGIGNFICLQESSGFLISLNLNLQVVPRPRCCQTSPPSGLTRSSGIWESRGPN